MACCGLLYGVVIVISYHKKIMRTDDAFFNRTGPERVGVVGPEPRRLWIGLKALDRRARPGLLLG